MNTANNTSIFTGELPSPFYRVTAKALVLDGQKRLLVVKSDKDDWEIPGGGWEYEESFTDCLRREVEEELGVPVHSVDNVRVVYRSKSKYGYWVVRIAAGAKLKHYNFSFGSGMVDAKFIAREEFLTLKFASSEETIKSYVDQIWPI